MAKPFHHARQGRSWRALGAIAAVWLAAALLHLRFDAALWITLPLLLLSMPATFEFWRGTTSGLTIDARGITWTSGARGETIPLARIEKVRLRTAMDFAQHATVETATSRHRIPPECLPPGQTLDAQLARHKIPYDRRLFAF